MICIWCASLCSKVQLQKTIKRIIHSTCLAYLACNEHERFQAFVWTAFVAFWSEPRCVWQKKRPDNRKKSGKYSWSSWDKNVQWIKESDEQKKKIEWMTEWLKWFMPEPHPTSSLKLTIWIINCYFPDDEKYFVLVWQQNTRISCPHLLAHCLWLGRNTTVAVTYTLTHTPSCYVPDYQKSSSLSWQRDCNFCSTSPVTLQIV